MRWITLVVAGALCLAACRHEPERDPVERFATKKLGVQFDSMPTAQAAREAAAAREVLAAQKLVARGGLVRAAARLRHAVDLRPGDVSLRSRLASVFERLGDSDAALGLLREARRIRPGDPTILHQLGKTLFFGVKTTDAKELAEAASAWNRLLEVAPASPNANHARKFLPVVRAALLRAQAPAPAKGGQPGMLPVRSTKEAKKATSTTKKAPARPSNP